TRNSGFSPCGHKHSHPPVSRLQPQQRQNQRQRHRIGQNDGQIVQHQPINQPQEHSQTKRQQHAQRQIVATLAPPRLVHLRNKGQRGQSSGGKSQKGDPARHLLFTVYRHRFSRSNHFSRCAGGVHSSNRSSMVSGLCATSTNCAFSLRTNPSSTARSKTASNPSQYFSTFSRPQGFC